MSKHFSSRPVTDGGAYSGGSWSSVYKTRNKNILIFATNSLLKIDWLWEMGVCLDQMETNWNGWEYAISVRKLLTPYDAPRSTYELVKEEVKYLDRKVNEILVAKPRNYRNHGDNYLWNLEKRWSKMLYNDVKDKEWISARHAIKFAMDRFDGNAWLLDTQYVNYLVCPITGVILPYDVVNFDYADSEDWGASAHGTY